LKQNSSHIYKKIINEGDRESETHINTSTNNTSIVVEIEVQQKPWRKNHSSSLPSTH
jgi:hypothetical protein